MFFRRKKESAPSWDEQLEAARRQGFTVEAEAEGRLRISKLGCAAVVEPAGEGTARFVEAPGLVVAGQIVKLIDRGFQKFVGDRPALAEQLRAIHHFDAELRQVLHLTSLYNESLGTVSNRYLYDRLKSRC